MSTEDSYRFSQTEFYYGGSGFLADLRGSIQGSLVLNGTAVVHREMVSTGTGFVGLTADGVDLGFTATVTLRATPEAQKLVANAEGFLMIHRKEPERAIALPVSVTAIPLSSDSGAVVSYSVTFTQAPGAVPVEGTALTTGSTAVPAGGAGYLKTATAITARTSGSLAVTGSGALGVVGTGLKGEGS